jgi:Permuted papain-like amidase enzyme, YaeF/YiiX, C92 family
MRFEKESARYSGDGFPTPLCVGDLVFIRVSALPFRWVARATGSWTNHVGVVIDVGGKEPVVAESRFPLSCTTSLSRFIGRSEGGRVTVTRLKSPLTAAQKHRVRVAANRRLGIFYDSGFNLHSRRQFCSRYVREVVGEATGTSIGEVETFATLLSRQAHSSLGFWRLWYFGRIPWHRETVSPANLLRSSELTTVFDSVAGNRGSPCHAIGSG